MIADHAPVFDAVAFDSGYLPSATDPIAIRFYVTPDGGLSTELLGTSELQWPDYAQRFADAPGGLVVLDGGVSVGAEVQLDLLGIFTGTVPLAEERIAFSDAALVDGLMLAPDPSAEGPVVALGDGVEPFPPLDYAIAVVPGVDLVVGVTVTPTVEATLSDAVISGTTTELLWFQQVADDWTELEPGEDRPGELGIVAAWSADLASELSIVLEPYVTVRTALGDFELLSFPIPIGLGGTVERREPDPQFVVHPLPVLGDLLPTIDFGEVPVGQDASYALALVDTGELLLEGAVTVVGDGAFTAWPLSVAALPDGADGLTLGFAPTQTGPAEGEVWIASNDPTRPLVKITLAGTGIAEQLDSTVVTDVGPAPFCGCATTDPSAAPLLLLAAGIARRRRHR